MIVLRPINLRWVRGPADDPSDLCAHGDVEFRIGDDTLLDAATVRELTVSAAALYLLRTLARPHTKGTPVGGNLFPCCGFSMYVVPEQEDVLIFECPRGENFEILHDVNAAGVVIRAADGRAWRVAWPAWRAAVFGFADAVSDFYAANAPKQMPPAGVDRKGVIKFLAEWERRRGQRLNVTMIGN